jgi:hypothetical protein
MKGKTYAKPAQNNELGTRPSPGIFPASFFRSQNDGPQDAFVLPSTTQFLLPPVSLSSEVLFKPKRHHEMAVFSSTIYHNATSFLNGLINSLSGARLRIGPHDVRDMPFPVLSLISLPKATCLPPILEVTRLDLVESTKHRDPDGVFPEFWWGFSF